MQHCPACGVPIGQNVRFCHHCGKDLRCYDGILKAERIAWLAGSCLSSLLSVWMCVMLWYIYLTDHFADVIPAFGFGRWYFYGVILSGQIFGTLVTVGGAVFGFVMTARIGRLLREGDTAAIIRRGGRIPMLVVSCLFNRIAAIFYLVNFVRIKAESRARTSKI